MCHGLLHAKGFDDRTEKDWLAMRQKEFEELARVL
jgi:ssRNA-specific RNase YbeY (16S rRNA maturation enzyme)